MEIDPNLSLTLKIQEANVKMKPESSLNAFVEGINKYCELKTLPVPELVEKVQNVLQFADNPMQVLEQ